MPDYDVPQDAQAAPQAQQAQSGAQQKVAHKTKKVISPPPSQVPAAEGKLPPIVIPESLEGKVEFLSALMDERARLNKKLSVIEIKLADMAKKESDDFVIKRLATAEKLRKAEKMDLLDSDSGPHVIEMSSDPNELLEMYRLTHEKLKRHRDRMAEIREKLHRILRSENKQEEEKLMEMLKSLEITSKRFSALSELVKEEGQGEEGDKLITLLKKRKDELQQDIEDEKRHIEEEALERQRKLLELEKQKEQAKIEAQKEEEVVEGFAQKLLSMFGGKKKPKVLKVIPCPKCKGKIEITTAKRPIKIKCKKCGAEGTLKK